MVKVGVFCGSRSGNNESFIKMSKSVGRWIAVNNFELVYGGGSIGLMGALADSCLESNGVVHGIIPKQLIDMEVAKKDVTHFYETSNMHERKQKMYDLSDLFIALPGGLGTLDELFEIITWGQLGLHKKKCYLYNFNGFFKHLIQHIDHLVETKFISTEDRKMITVIESLGELVLK